MSRVLKAENVFLKLQLKKGYLLEVKGNNEFLITHENGNGIILLESRASLLDYMSQINEEFDLVDQYGNSIDVVVKTESKEG
ncbi:TPA: hypothetical protein LUJ97_001683 [Acinetobacter nosocomialis]|nr:hypothetical protein [Acinetobacter nosocomialis]